MRIVLAYLMPEIWLTLLGFFILIADFMSPRGNRRWLGLVAGWGVAGAVLLTIVQMWWVSHAEPGLTGATDTLSHFLSGSVAVDNMALFLKLAILIGSTLVIFSALDYAERRIHHAPGEFWAFLVFASLSMCFMTVGIELITLFLAIEFTSIASYLLAAWLRDDPRSSEAGMKYFLVGATTTAVTLYGMSLVYGLTGSTHLIEISEAIQAGGSSRMLLVAGVLMLASLGFKVAMVPFHGWAPDTYEGAPTPITAFLSVASKAAGFAIILRILIIGLGVDSAQWGMTIAFISVASMTLGNLAAIPQRNIKRLMAYSSIAQVGYMLIAVACFNAIDLNVLTVSDGVKHLMPAGATNDWTLLMGGREATSEDMALPGLLFYVLAYTFSNMGAFAVIILVGNAIGSDHIDDYSGLIKRNPWATVLMTVFFLSLIGIPFFAGFWAKLMIFGGAIARSLTEVSLPDGTIDRPYSHLAWLVVIGVVNSVISVYYYLEVVRRMWFHEPKDPSPIRGGLALNGVLTVCFIATVVLFGLFPGLFMNLAQQSVEGALRILGAV